MKRFALTGLGMLGLLWAPLTQAELQNVEVGGKIEIWGNLFTGLFENGDTTRIDAPAVFGRPIGGTALDALGAINSIIRNYDGDGGRGSAWIEQRTTLHINADFTEEVSAFVEFESIDDWGEDFRSDYVTGLDGRGATGDDVEMYQGYIQANQVFGYPVQVRMGRQELILGNGWLVGNNFYWDPLTYLSFDGVRATYTGAAFMLDVFWMKPVERFGDFGDQDVDLYGIYGGYTGVENWEFNAYWLFLRDGLDVEATAGGPVLEGIEHFLGLDTYETTTIHTVGLHGAGTVGGWDLEGEIAYQWGKASTAGVTFAPFLYGDEDAEYGQWGGHFNVGYQFESKWSPYVYVGGEYYGGEDNRDVSLFDLLNPFYQPQASISFNRLYSSFEADSFLDGSNMSNIWMLKAGGTLSPTEKLELGLDMLYFEVVEPFDTPVLGRVGKSRTPVYSIFPFWTRESDEQLAWEFTFWLAYAYSEDLSFELGWGHFFPLEGLEDGSFVDSMGLEFYGGLDDDESDYFWFATTVEF
ncbi:MAG: alginate export family protein [Candidatus Hydrogenedentes bacterium]|nr:alginate export family protein [Candidatus Hydrogenedentota bacterium]